MPPRPEPIIRSVEQLAAPPTKCPTSAALFNYRSAPEPTTSVDRVAK